MQEFANEQQPSEEEEKVNKFIFKAKPKEKESKLRYRKQFIDYEEDEEFLRQKKKQKEILYGNKKQSSGAAKKSKASAAEEKANDVIVKLENNQKPEKGLKSASQIRAKKLMNNNTKSSIKLINEETTQNIMSKDIDKNTYNDNLVISEFNVIIRKSFLKSCKEDYTAEDAFMLDYVNPEVLISSEADRIIIPKYILQNSNLPAIVNINNNILKNTKSSITKPKKTYTPTSTLSKKKQSMQDPLAKKASKKQSSKNYSSELKRLPKKQNKLDNTSCEITSYAGKKENLASEEQSESEEVEQSESEEESSEEASESQDEESQEHAQAKLNFENYNEPENENDEDYSESNLMQYNDRNFRRKQKQFDDDFVSGTQKKAAPKQAPQAPLKLSYHEKLSQKDLLYEAIFTELYNIKSLEDMQRLEELNKRDVNYSSKRQFSEFIKVKRRILIKDDVAQEAKEGEGAVNKQLENKEEDVEMIDVVVDYYNNGKSSEVSEIARREEFINEAEIKQTAEKREEEEQMEKETEKVDIEELIRRKMLENQKEEESGN